MKLISMTDFVLKQNYITTLDISQIDFYDKELSVLSKIRNYAKFLKQPLKLEMFITCDEVGEILHPQYIGGKEVIYDRYVQDAMMDKVLEYQQAKDKVLFEGFWLDETYKMNNRQLPYLTNGEISVFLHSDFAIRNEFIEEISDANVTLTPSAIKQLGL